MLMMKMRMRMRMMNRYLWVKNMCPGENTFMPERMLFSVGKKTLDLYLCLIKKSSGSRRKMTEMQEITFRNRLF